MATITTRPTADPCGPLTDTEYLQHMIPHHQVGLDMSRRLLETSKWPDLLGMARHIIWVQDMEIKLMTAVLNSTHMEPVSMSEQPQNIQYIQTIGDTTPPNTLAISDTPCDPSFFGTQHDGHASHRHRQHVDEMADDAYIAHMIPHHQVAVDMSKRLLKSTTNDYMIDLAYSIIRSQQTEIARLSALSKSHMHTRFQSDLLSQV